MAKEDRIARWMFDQVQREGYLDRKTAAYEIRTQFGLEYVHPTDLGGWSIDRKILKAFEKQSGVKVVYASSSGCWRLRKPTDAPGRKQEGF